MAKPLTPQEREAILADIKAGELSRNAIAKKHHRSPGTISNITREAGLEGVAFDRTATAQASRAKQIDNKARRAALVEAYLGDAELIRERLWESSEVVSATGEVIYLSRPGARDVRDFVVAGTSLIKASIDVEKHDTNDGATGAVSVIAEIMDGLRGVHRAGSGDVGSGD